MFFFFFLTHIVWLDVRVCVFHPIIDYNNRDSLAGHVVLPHPCYIYVHAFITEIVLTQKKVKRG